MRIVLILTLLIFSSGMSSAQNGRQSMIDSLKRKLLTINDDSVKSSVLDTLTDFYQNFDKDSSQFYANQIIEFGIKTNDFQIQSRGLNRHALVSRIYGEASKGLEYAFKALKLGDEKNQSLALYSIGLIYWDVLGDSLTGLKYLKMSEEKRGLDHIQFGLSINLAELYNQLNKFDSSKIYLEYSENFLKQGDKQHCFVQGAWSEWYARQNRFEEALEASNLSLSIIEKYPFERGHAEVYIARAELFNKLEDLDSCLFYAEKAFKASKEINYKNIYNRSASMLARKYEKTDLVKSLFYYKQTLDVREDLYGLSKFQEVQRILAQEQERQRLEEADRVLKETNRRKNTFLGGIGLLSLITFLLYRNFMREKKAKDLLKSKNVEIENTLRTLKSTQAQLIQSEKMASLGELTAGIAHEIQNPLNFVNNFSEVSEEMIQEIKEERQKPKDERNEALEEEILTDLEQNLQKINHHGNRASSIVKGMLEHSKSSSGTKELTDINALADEYLRLAYHGLRAKDKSFNAEMVTDFDTNVPKVNVVSQDIGRVLLNIITNAFHATSERGTLREEGYKPLVSVNTQLTADGRVLIAIKDNGLGIPAEIRDKIFQPFFTTKDTGKGTGLGLSLAYDIVTAHGGELKMESKENIGSKFSIIFRNTITKII